MNVHKCSLPRHVICLSIVFLDAESIASIRIEIGATEAASEAAEAAKLAT